MDASQRPAIAARAWWAIALVVIVIMALCLAWWMRQRRVPGTEWTLTWRGYVAPTAIVTDSDEGVYVAGSFKGAVDLDPSWRARKREASGDISSFLLKLSSHGDMRWVVCDDGVMANDVVLDPLNNIYVVGRAADEAEFELDAAGNLQLVRRTAEARLSKYTQDGQTLWERSWGGDGFVEATCVAGDQNGMIYFGGSFNGIIDFDPGPGVLEQATSGESDAFIASFQPSGELGWLRVCNHDGWADIPLAMEVDDEGNIYVLYTSTPHHTPEQISSPKPGVAGEEMSLSKYHSNGDLEFESHWKTEGVFYWFGDVAVSANGSVYVIGGFTEKVAFDTISTTESAAASDGLMDVFLACFDPTGVLLHLHSFGGSGLDFGNALVIDESGCIYATGATAIGIDPRTGGRTLNPNIQQMYLRKYDAALSLLWEWRYSRSWAGTAMALDHAGNLYIGGWIYNGCFVSKIRCPEAVLDGP